MQNEVVGLSILLWPVNLHPPRGHVTPPLDIAGLSITIGFPRHKALYWNRMLFFFFGGGRTLGGGVGWLAMILILICIPVAA